MALYRTLSQASDTTQPDLIRGLAKTALVQDQFINWLDPVMTDRPSIFINREISYGSASVTTGASTITSESIQTLGFSFPLLTYTKQFDVANDVTALAATYEDQVMLETEGALQALFATIGADIITGNGSTGVLGIDSQVTSTVAVSGAFTVGDIDSALIKLKQHSNKEALVVGPDAYVAVLRELRKNQMIVGAQLVGGFYNVPTYNNRPVLLNENIASGAGYLVNGDPARKGFNLYVGPVEGANIAPWLKVRKVAERIDADRTVYRCQARVASVLHSPLSVVKITGIV